MWILLTLAAATLQTFRNLEQKNLNKKLDTITVSWSRFILPFPFALLTIFYSFNQISHKFIGFCLTAAILQIAANIFLLKTVKSKNFSIGVLFYKSETLQVALLGWLFFDQTMSMMAYLAVAVACVGMYLMSEISLKQQKFDSSAVFGILSGFCFALCSFYLKKASEEIISDFQSSFTTAMLVLMWVIAIQNICLMLIKFYQKTLIIDLKKLFAAENKKSFLITSALSFLGSICWFLAFTIGNVVYVKAVAQIEVVIAVALSHFYLRETHNKREALGMVVTVFGILLVVFS